MKYHIISDQEESFLTNAEAATIAGSNRDYDRQDLFEAIENGDYPSWTVYVQLIPEAEGLNYTYDIFDATKIVNETDYPYVEVGRLILNTNPVNFFAENE